MGISRYDVDAETATADTAHLVNPDAAYLADAEAAYVEPAATQIPSGDIIYALTASTAGIVGSKLSGSMFDDITTGTLSKSIPIISSSAATRPIRSTAMTATTLSSARAATTGSMVAAATTR